MAIIHITILLFAFSKVVNKLYKTRGPVQENSCTGGGVVFPQPNLHSLSDQEPSGPPSVGGDPWANRGHGARQ